jgi:hypothetical protein
MTTVDHGFDLKAIRANLDREDWESDPENPGYQVRRIYLGDVFSLTPSGKMYMPFACGNLDACETCKGTGSVVPRRYRRRTQKKHATRHAKVMARFDALWGKGDETGAPMPSLGPAYRPAGQRAAFRFIDRQPKRFRLRYLSVGTTCTACGGCGSREAHVDELWNEAAEETVGSIDGVHLSWEDGDAFAVETRDAPEDDDESEPEPQPDDSAEFQPHE